jgi:hypothetical protein
MNQLLTYSGLFVLLLFGIPAVIGETSNADEEVRYPQPYSEKDIPPAVNLKLAENKVFCLRRGNRYELYRYKSLLEVTAVQFFRDSTTGVIVSKPVATMRLAGSRWHFHKTIMVQADLCRREFDSLNDARQAYSDGKVNWIQDVIRPPTMFKRDIEFLDEAKSKVEDNHDSQPLGKKAANKE